MPNYFSKPDALVDAVRTVLTGQPVEVNETNKNDKSDDGEGLDAVQPKAVKKKFDDRKDKDIDNDGDVDSSDEYLHKRRKAVSKAVKEEENPANSQHLCAKNVVHESWGEGSCVATMHADPDEEGNIEWYDVMFDHGIEEQVSIEELKVTKAESHIHASKKKIKESKDEDDDDDDEDDKPKAKKGEDKDSSKEDENNGKKGKVSGKKDTIDTEPDMKDQQMTSEMSDAQEKKREEIVLSMKKKMPEFKKKYGDRAKDVMYATATKMAMKEGFELGIEKLKLIEEVELDEATVNVGDIKKKQNINRGDKSKLSKVADMMAREREIYRKGKSKRNEEADLEEKLDKDDETVVKKVVGKLKKASQAHAGQSKELEKALDEEKYRVTNKDLGVWTGDARSEKEAKEKAMRKWGVRKSGPASVSFMKNTEIVKEEEVDLDEAKSGTGYDLYHKDFSSAMKHAYDHAKKKHGITVDPSEIDNKVATGPAKPREGKTNTYRLKGDKGAIQIQVYNKGGSKPFELNMYKEEVELDEDASNFKSAVARINKAKSVKDLHGLEKSFERIYKQTDAFTVKEFGKLDSMIVDKLVKLDESTMSSSQIARLKKAYEPMRDKKISTSNANKLSAMMDKVGKDKEALIQLFKADIPFVSQSAVTQLITKHDMKGAEINKLREEVDLDEGFINIGGAKVKDDEKSILQHIKKTFPNVKKVRKDPNHGWIPVFEEADLDEGRGRPRKDGTKSDTEDREQIQMQLRKSISLRGLKDVEFDDGKKIKVSARDARDVLGKLDAIKAPRERQNAVVHIAKSHKNFVDFAKGKTNGMDPEKKKMDILKNK